MTTWSKLLRSGRMMLPIMIVLAATGCCFPEPQSDAVFPNSAAQGSDLVVTFTGDHFNDPCSGTPQIIVDGPNNISGVTVTARGPYSQTQIQFTLHIDQAATIGVHSIAVQTAAGISDPLPFYVTCPPCPPPPQLLRVVNQDNLPLLPGGPPVRFRIFGLSLLNNNPEVHIDGPGINFQSGPYNVQPFDYFDLLIAAGANATPGDHNIWVATDGGTSETKTITVTAPRPASSGLMLKTIDPSHISVSPAGPVLIRLKGSGFGTNRSLMVNGEPCCAQIIETPQADPDSVIIAYINPASLPPDHWVTLRVHNWNNNTESNDLYLVLDDLVGTWPKVYSCDPDSITRGTEEDVYVTGDTLQNTTESCFSGIPGLTFSNVHPDPFFPGHAFWVHVRADASGPVTGDEATNLFVFAHDPGVGWSNNFAFFVYPGNPVPRPDINNITPPRVTKVPGNGVQVSFKLEGTGFGTRREIILVAARTQHLFPEVNHTTDPEQVAVGVTDFYPVDADTSMTVYMHDLDTDMVSDPVTWFLDQPVPVAPVVSLAYGRVTQNGDNDLFVEGPDLVVTEESFSGIQGLTFSDVRPTDPIYPGEQAFWVHVHADASAPLSGDEVTNLIITDGSGRQSNPFWIGIDP